MEQLSFLQSIILGIIQGLTEFLPISSSAHLIITREVFNFPEPGKTFDIIVHFGTLVALIVYFREDLAKIITSFYKSARRKKLYGTPEVNLFWFLIISTIPGGLFGALFNEKLEKINNIYLIGALLIGFGILLLVFDWKGSQKLDINSFTFKDALIVGLFQALALFPGVSRSGVTITAALFLGYTREDSARYSFLISIPLIAGISVYGTYKLFKAGPDSMTITVFALGFLAAAVSGFLCIKFLLNYLKKGSFVGFVIYRVVIGLALIIAAAANWVN